MSLITFLAHVAMETKRTQTDMGVGCFCMTGASVVTQDSLTQTLTALICTGTRSNLSTWLHHFVMTRTKHQQQNINTCNNVPTKPKRNDLKRFNTCWQRQCSIKLLTFWPEQSDQMYTDLLIVLNHRQGDSPHCPQRLCWPAWGRLVSRCFEPSQPLGITSGLKTNFHPSLSYSAHKSFKTNHNISTAQFKYFTTHTHTYAHTIFLQNQNNSMRKEQGS